MRWDMTMTLCRLVNVFAGLIVATLVTYGSARAEAPASGQNHVVVTPRS
ncbi:MAG: hypothetical protein JSR60_02655 [Proteobacteria bacterium]|nr:hypothetical protein [Pseudomonadota bacterium]